MKSESIVMKKVAIRIQIQRAIDHYCDTMSVEKFTPEVIENLKNLYEFYSKDENDYRTGEETYGYESDESIMYTFEYISDRWLCAFRIRWILDGLEQGKF